MKEHKEEGVRTEIIKNLYTFPLLPPYKLVFSPFFFKQISWNKLKFWFNFLVGKIMQQHCEMYQDRDFQRPAITFRTAPKFLVVILFTFLHPSIRTVMLWAVIGYKLCDDHTRFAILYLHIITYIWVMFATNLLLPHTALEVKADFNEVPISTLFAVGNSSVS